MMMMMMTDIVGYAAAILGTLVMVPQVVKSIRTKSVRDLSNTMLAAYLSSCILWEIYGFMIGSLPVILCNLIAFGIGTTQVFLKITYRK